MNPILVKICGLTRADDARAAWDAGADFLGFVLHPPSPRAVTPAQLVRLRDALPSEARCVGVFVNTSAPDVETVCREAGLCAAQLAGSESAADFADFPIPVWRVVRTNGGAWTPEPLTWTAARYVADAPGPLPGGSGRTADWPRAAELARRVPILLAGGLTPDNVAEAIRNVAPDGVDVSSGIESKPGHKDVSKLRHFLQEARAAHPLGDNR